MLEQISCGIAERYRVLHELGLRSNDRQSGLCELAFRLDHIDKRPDAVLIGVE